MSNTSPTIDLFKSWYTPNDAAIILCEALIKQNFEPTAITLNLIDSDMYALGVKLNKDDHILPMLIMLGGAIKEILSVKYSKATDKDMFNFLQDIGQPIYSTFVVDGQIIPENIIVDDAIAWPNIPLLKVK